MRNLSTGLENAFKKSCDFISNVIKISIDGIEHEIKIFYIQNLINDEIVGNNIVKPIIELKELPKENTIEFLKSKITLGNIDSTTSLKVAKEKMLSGCLILEYSDNREVLIVPVQGWDKRAISEPPTSAVLKGPREGFTEDIKTNIGLIRRRIKSSDLIIEEKVLGKYTATKVNILYINSIAEPKVVKEVKKRLSKINIDGLIDSFYIQSLLEFHQSVIFKQIGNTEKPDVATSKLLEGRVLILMDGSPIALSIPYLLLEDFQSGDDYYMHPLRTSFTRILRLIGLILAIILPGLYVAVESFHYRLLPIEFLVTLSNSIHGIAFPPLVEILFVLFLFEILNEASIRMPKYLGMALSIIGALILGDTAVQAGLISSPSVMIVALSGITLYTVPDQSAPCSLLRIVFTVLGGLAGFYGILIGFIYLTTYLLDLDSYGTPYMAPYAPTIPEDKKDGLTKTRLANFTTRPKSIPNINNVRMKNE